jgi:Protein of unknown function (DUF664)
MSTEPPSSPGWTPPAWEPPVAGSEIEHLLGAITRMRTTFRWKAGHLDAAGLATTLAPSSLTLGGLLLHLALVEDFMSTTKLRGEELAEPWRSLGHDGSDDWEFGAANSLSPEELYRLYDDAVERADGRIAAALEEGGLDFVCHVDDGNGNHASLRRLLFDHLEEYGRHTGHADLLRESVDGLAGEDPPGDWAP